MEILGLIDCKKVHFGTRVFKFVFCNAYVVIHESWNYGTWTIKDLNFLFQIAKSRWIYRIKFLSRTLWHGTLLRRHPRPPTSSVKKKFEWLFLRSKVKRSVILVIKSVLQLNLVSVLFQSSWAVLILKGLMWFVKCRKWLWIVTIISSVFFLNIHSYYVTVALHLVYHTENHYEREMMFYVFHF